MARAITRRGMRPFDPASLGEARRFTHPVGDVLSYSLTTDERPEPGRRGRNMQQRWKRAGAFASAVACTAGGMIGACGDSLVEPLGGVDADVDAAPAFDAARLDAEPDADATTATVLPESLAETGLYADFASHTLADGVVPYTPGLTFWSDGAEKHRFLFLPPGASIDTSDVDEWVFPVGTKVWKEFVLGGKRIETRIFWKTSADEWLFTTYRWSDDEATATRFDEGARPTTDGGYEIPSQFQCAYCHGGRRDRVLGLDAVSLGHAGATGVTLATLVAEGRLTTPPTSTAYPLPEDTTGHAGAALGWLHVNCGTACHNRNEGAAANGTGLFLRLSAAGRDGGAYDATETDTYTTAVGVAMQEGSVYAGNAAYAGFLRIKPGAPGASLVPALAGLRGSGQMPPVASHQVDPVGVAALFTWISAVPE